MDLDDAARLPTLEVHGARAAALGRSGGLWRGSTGHHVQDLLGTGVRAEQPTARAGPHQK